MTVDLVYATAQPTIDTAVYASGDRLGAVGTFAAMGYANAGTGVILGATLDDDANSNFDIQLWLFRVTPTMVNADNGVFDLTDANFATADFVGVIDFLSAHTSTRNSGRVTPGSIKGAMPFHMPYKCASADTALYGIMKALGAYDAAATDDLVIRLFAQRVY